MNVVEDYLVVKRAKGTLHGILWKNIHNILGEKRRDTREPVLYLYNGQQRQIYSSRDRFTAIRECMSACLGLVMETLLKNIGFT